MSHYLHHRGSRVDQLIEQADGPIAEEKQEKIVAQLEAEAVMLWTIYLLPGKV